MTTGAASPTQDSDDDGCGSAHGAWLRSSSRDGPACCAWHCSLPPNAVAALAAEASALVHEGGRTFWLQASDIPACALEAFALATLRFHNERIASGTLSGVEWWAQVRSSEQPTPSINWHWDSDEKLKCESGEHVPPFCATVTYLGDAGAPTAILPLACNAQGRAVEAKGGGGAYLSYPRTGKHLSFDGRLLHAAPHALAPDTGPCTRITLLVNLWLRHRPHAVERLPATLAQRIFGATATIGVRLAEVGACFGGVVAEAPRLPAALRAAARADGAWQKCAIGYPFYHPTVEVYGLESPPLADLVMGDLWTASVALRYPGQRPPGEKSVVEPPVPEPPVPEPPAAEPPAAKPAAPASLPQRCSLTRHVGASQPKPHYVNDLRIDSRGPVNRPCFAFQQGSCARGEACRFVHGTPLADPPPRWRLPVNVAACTVGLPTSLRPHRLCEAPSDVLAELTALVRAALRVADEYDLSYLHELPEGGARVAGRARNGHYQKRWKAALQARSSEWRSRLDRCMRRFVGECAAVDALEAHIHGYRAVCYQAEPSLRIHAPHAPGGIQLHKDADYYHQPNEVNLWIPLSEGVNGTNSLYCESAPGVGDYTPFTVPRGSYMRFWGNQCHHHTVINTTESTRVSLDMRVVPMELYDPSWANPHGRVCFRLGEYYDEAQVAVGGWESQATH